MEQKELNIYERIKQAIQTSKEVLAKSAKISARADAQLIESEKALAKSAKISAQADKQLIESEKVLKESIKIVEAGTKSKEWSLFKAIFENNILSFNKAFKKFSNKAEILNCRYPISLKTGDTYYFTPLFMAAEKGFIEIVKKLLEIPEINIDEEVIFHPPAQCFSTCHTPLGKAIENSLQFNTLEVIKLLLSKGANPNCSYSGSVDPLTTALVNIYKYRITITNELHSWLYENITLPVKTHFTFFKEHFRQDKVDKLEVVNLIIDVLEGKQDASVLNNLTERQDLAIDDGRLKVAFDNIRSQLPEAKTVGALSF